MLTYMRKHSKSWLIKFVFGLIILSFAVGTGFMMMNRNSSAVAKVDKVMITEAQYRAAYGNAVEAYRQRFGNYLNAEMLKRLNLERSVLDSLIDSYIIEQEAKRLGIVVTDEDLQAEVEKNFSRNGQYDDESYRRYLSASRLSAPEFEIEWRKMLVRQRLETMLSDGVVVADFEVEASYLDKNDTYNLNYIAFSPADYAAAVVIDDGELGIFYDEQKEKYRTAPESVIEYIEFSFDDIDAKVSDEDVRRYYDENMDRYSSEATAKARHILVKVEADADEATVSAKQAEAEKLLADAKAGKDFAALAKTHSEDPGSAAKGGDLGEVKMGAFVDNLDGELFNMQPGEIAGPFRTRFGFHILKMDGLTPASTRSFDEVAAEIRENLAEIAVRDLAYDQAHGAFMDIYELSGMDINAYAEVKGLKVEETGPFTEKGGAAIPQGSLVAGEAFKFQEGELGDVIKLDDGYLVYKVKTRIPARIPELDEVREAVIDDLTKEKSFVLAREAAEKMAAAELEGDIKTTGEFKNSAWSIPKLGNLPSVKQDLAELETPKVYASNGMVYVVWLKDKVAADLAEMTDKQRESIRNELLNQKRQALFQQFMEEARSRHKIVIYEKKLI